MRLIDKDALMDDIATTIENSGCVNHEKEILDCVEFADTIDAVPVVRGEWYQCSAFDEDENVYTCSVCGEPWVLIGGTPPENNMNFCPNCGADMRGEM